MLNRSEIRLEQEESKKLPERRGNSQLGFLKVLYFVTGAEDLNQKLDKTLDQNSSERERET